MYTSSHFQRVSSSTVNLIIYSQQFLSSFLLLITAYTACAYALFTPSLLLSSISSAIPIHLVVLLWLTSSILILLFLLYIYFSKLLPTVSSNFPLTASSQSANQTHATRLPHALSTFPIEYYDMLAQSYIQEAIQTKENDNKSIQIHGGTPLQQLQSYTDSQDVTSATDTVSVAGNNDITNRDSVPLAFLCYHGVLGVTVQSVEYVYGRIDSSTVKSILCLLVTMSLAPFAVLNFSLAIITLLLIFPIIITASPNTITLNRPALLSGEPVSFCCSSRLMLLLKLLWTLLFCPLSILFAYCSWFDLSVMSAVPQMFISLSRLQNYGYFLFFLLYLPTFIVCSVMNVTTQYRIKTQADRQKTL